MFLGTGGDTKTDEYSEKFQAWVILNPKTNFANFGHLYRALKQVFQKKIAIRYSENEGGSKAVWNFSENSSVSVPWPVPKRYLKWVVNSIIEVEPWRVELELEVELGVWSGTNRIVQTAHSDSPWGQIHSAWSRMSGLEFLVSQHQFSAYHKWNVLKPFKPRVHTIFAVRLRWSKCV